MQKKYRVGIDVGGTNTDCVIFSAKDKRVIGQYKSLTTSDVTDGISLSLQNALENSEVKSTEISSLAIGTTHFINALLSPSSQQLRRVAVIRLGKPYTAQVPSFVDFPPSLRRIMKGYTTLLDGGLQVDGEAIKSINPQEIRGACDEISTKGLKDIVVVGVFSPLDPKHEYAARDIIRDHLGNRVNIVCSCEVGPIGFVERENAAILDCSMRPLARRTIAAYRRVIQRLKIDCPLYLTQLDGTLLEASLAAEHPIRTFANGPTNSMIGAGFLATSWTMQKEEKEANEAKIVIDIGGTSTDIGVLLPSGFPRVAGSFSEVGGVRMNFSMPDIHSIPVGGGSIVRFSASEAASIGPDSVGNAITEKAMIFGGDTLTLSDVVSAESFTRQQKGVMALNEAEDVLQLGDPSRMQDILTPEQVDKVLKEMKRLLENAIDRLKPSSDPVSVILVGGGSVLIPSTFKLRGVKSIVRPPHFSVANAIGAALGRVSGEVDRVVLPNDPKKTWDDLLDELKDEAVQKAMERGAKNGSVSVAEVRSVQLPYVANGATRVVIKAVGELEVDAPQTGSSKSAAAPEEADGEDVTEDDTDIPAATIEDNEPPLNNTTQEVDLTSYRPNVIPTARGNEWLLRETDLEFLSEGCAVLGCGGGGAPYPAFLAAREVLRSGAQIRVVDLQYFLKAAHEAGAREVAGKGVIQPVGFMGSPSVSFERIPSGNELVGACEALKGMEEVRKKGGMVGIVSTEIGGKNGIEPMRLASSAFLNLPVLDGDLMGRAYPLMNQITPCISSSSPNTNNTMESTHTNALTPTAASDGVGNTILIPRTNTDHMVERLLRVGCTELGSAMGVAMAPLRVEEYERKGLMGSVSFAWRVGREICVARKEGATSRIPERILRVQGGKLLFSGKVVDVQREVRGGFTWGKLTVVALRQDEIDSSETASKGPTLSAGLDLENKLVIPFQNENLAAILVSPNGSEQTLCSVPDLIAVLSTSSGSSIGTQEYRYGLRVTVIGLVGDPKWRTVEGLALGGSAAFRLEAQYSPIGEWRPVSSVIGEYSPLEKL